MSHYAQCIPNHGQAKTRPPQGFCWTAPQVETGLKITRIEAIQVAWPPNEKPQQHSAFVLVHTDDGLTNIGEASPMQWGTRIVWDVSR